MYLVYKATNRVNGKIYFGKTNNLTRRKIEHISEARRNRNYHFYNAIRKYGSENFIFELVQTFETEEAAYQAEIDLIQQFKTTDPKIGYNRTPGGNGVRVTEAERQRRSALGKTWVGSKNPFYGRTHSVSTRQRLSESRKAFVGERHPLWGTSHSTETRDKISQSKLGKAVWSTEQRREIGHRSAGERSSTAKITNAQATELREKFENGASAKELQVLYGLSKASVWKVIHRQTFREVL